MHAPCHGMGNPGSMQRRPVSASVERPLARLFCSSLLYLFVLMTVMCGPFEIPDA